MKTAAIAVMTAALLVTVAGSLAPVTAQEAKPAAAGVGGIGGQPAQGIRPAPTMMRFPTISRDKICFVYGNDLWVVGTQGGVASPLSTRPGAKGLPKFSPDGKTIAFTATADGNPDLYTIPVDGGEAQRVTHHPARENMAGWTPDGKLLFITNGFGGLQRQTQLMTVPATGGQPEMVPVPYGAFGSISPDGTWLAYTLHSTDNRTWKRYRGGMATDVWLFNLKDKTSRKITDWEGTDTLPMWGANGAKVFYLSDMGPEHRLNIWSFDPKSGERAQVTKFTDDDVRWPSLGPGALVAGKQGAGEIIFQLGSSLRVINLDSNEVREVKVTIPGDRPTIRTRTVDASKFMTGGSTVSPTGKRVVSSARGDLWSLPAKEGAPRNLTRSNAVFERDPAWSPDGKWIAYFSDESGEYELWIAPSGAKPAEEKKDADKKDGEGKDDAKKDDAKKDGEKKDEPKADDKKDEAKKDDVAKAAKKDEPPPAPRKLTSLGAGFRMNPTWSPDSKLIVFGDKNGRVFLCDVEKGDTKEIDKDPYMEGTPFSWSADSNWIAYHKSNDGRGMHSIFLYRVDTGAKTRVTEPMFDATSPAFDRKGEWLFYASKRNINAPQYSELDLSFIYNNAEVLVAAPLKKDVKSPYLPKSDEEELKPAKKEPEKKADKKDDKNGEKKDDGKPEGAAANDDGITGTWSCNATGPNDAIPGGSLPFTMIIKRDSDGSLSGSVSSPLVGKATITGGTFDKESGDLRFTMVMPKGSEAVVSGKVTGGSFSGTWKAGEMSGTINGSRTGTKADVAKGDDKSDKADKKGSDDKVKKWTIDLEGLEARSMQLPVAPGNFGNLAVSDDGKLLYVRSGARGSSEGPTIKIFDLKDDAKEEKTVTSGGGFEMTGDGKKLLVSLGGMRIVDASAGGGKAITVPTAGMRQEVKPRDEWRQILTDTWRQFRDYFYEPTMHGVDWNATHEHYLKMIDDCVSREDVFYVQSEMVSELNIGHAYINSPGDVENTDSVPVGLLGVDFELDRSGEKPAFKITKIYQGGVWDTDARGPLSQPGMDVKVGDYVLAVNGAPVDTSQDVYAAFVGTADRTTALTVSAKPVVDHAAREVLVKPVGSEANLRYRAWIERNRAYVAEKSGGKVGYIYVPNTGQDGQSDLFRQFYGQAGMPALIIDERWNGGGQIPTRFIELLNRPVTNYWARRDGTDWTWPPDSHQGPKCMLINGLAGSGGDMFPWLFKHNKIGKVIGQRTWGGLVGISGNPPLIDGATISVPTFGFYKTDGTWGVEGHGVDPDMPVLDDPALMQNGGDPQLDAAINLMLEEIKTKGYTPPARPASPDRKGMGIPEKDR